MGYRSSVSGGEEAWLDGGTVKVFCSSGRSFCYMGHKLEGKAGGCAVNGRRCCGGLEGNLLLIKLQAGK